MRSKSYFCLNSLSTGKNVVVYLLLYLQQIISITCDSEKIHLKFYCVQNRCHYDRLRNLIQISFIENDDNCLLKIKMNQQF